MKRQAAMQYGILFTPSKMTIHTCSYQDCKKQFVNDQKTKIVDYLNRHTDMKPYDCGYCDKAFVIWYLRNRHATVCKGEESPEQYTFHI